MCRQVGKVREGAGRQLGFVQAGRQVGQGRCMLEQAMHRGTEHAWLCMQRQARV